MIITAIDLFAFAALLGVFLLVFILKNKETPKAVTFIHGPAAVIGLILLIIYSFQYRPAPIASLALFIIAAIGGAAISVLNITGKSIPKWLALLHGSLAVAGFIFLVAFAL